MLSPREYLRKRIMEVLAEVIVVDETTTNVDLAVDTLLLTLLGEGD